MIAAIRAKIPTTQQTLFHLRLFRLLLLSQALFSVLIGGPYFSVWNPRTAATAAAVAAGEEDEESKEEEGGALFELAFTPRSPTPPLPSSAVAETMAIFPVDFLAGFNSMSLPFAIVKELR